MPANACWPRTSPLTEAEGTYAAPGRYQIAVKVTDVFGNDGLTVLNVEVR